MNIGVKPIFYTTKFSLTNLLCHWMHLQKLTRKLASFWTHARTKINLAKILINYTMPILKKHTLGTWNLSKKIWSCNRGLSCFLFPLMCAAIFFYFCHACKRRSKFNMLNSFYRSEIFLAVCTRPDRGIISNVQRTAHAHLQFLRLKRMRSLFDC